MFQDSQYILRINSQVPTIGIWQCLVFISSYRKDGFSFKATSQIQLHMTHLSLPHSSGHCYFPMLKAMLIADKPITMQKVPQMNSATELSPIVEIEKWSLVLDRMI